ncbi:MAG: DUF3306 domain-containing protein [Roseibium sp.]
MSESDSSGSDFWSRRKAAVQQAEVDEKLHVEAEEIALKKAELAEKSDAEILEELNLPDPETLTEKDDFSQFLSAAVPERLKRRALRRLWGLNPLFANLDGLVDYGEDYTDAATVISDLQTVYKVGRGMVDRFVEALENDENEDLVAETIESDVADSSDEPVDVAPHTDIIQNGNTSIHLTPTETLVQDENQYVESIESEEYDAVEDEEYHSPKRRMRFDYS